MGSVATDLRHDADLAGQVRPERTQMRNVYIVDDDEAVRRSLHHLLSRRNDLAIYNLESGDAFLERHGEFEPGVVLLDYNMPGTGGLAVATRLAEQRSKFAVVMLTAHGDVALSVAAMKAGADDFIVKPYDPADLLPCLERAFVRLEADRRREAVRDGARDRLSRLSPREHEVLSGLVSGWANKEIARDLGISPRTVEIYRANLMSKLEVDSLSHAIGIVYRAGMAA